MSAIKHHATVEKPAPKIPKGFVLVNLAERQQKELRTLSQKSGMALRDALRWSLTGTRERLKEQAEFKRRTGMTWREFDMICPGFFGSHN